MSLWVVLVMGVLGLQLFAVIALLATKAIRSSPYGWILAATQTSLLLLSVFGPAFLLLPFAPYLGAGTLLAIFCLALVVALSIRDSTHHRHAQKQVGNPPKDES